MHKEDQQNYTIAFI